MAIPLPSNHSFNVERAVSSRFMFDDIDNISSSPRFFLSARKDGARKRSEHGFSRRERDLIGYEMKWTKSTSKNRRARNLKFISSGYAKGCVARASVIFFCRPGERIIALLHKPRPAWWTSCPGRCHWPTNSEESLSCRFVSPLHHRR